MRNGMTIATHNPLWTVSVSGIAYHPPNRNFRMRNLIDGILTGEKERLQPENVRTDANPVS
jgi:hypothetical protein